MNNQQPKENKKEEPGKAEEEMHLNLDKAEVKPEAPKTFGFETTKPVSFIIGGQKFEGTTFVFDNEEVAEARKQMLVEAHGKDVIK